MSKITSLMTSLHEGHKTEERLKCIDNMLFKKCEDTKDTILQAFWWYRKHSIPLEKIKQAREEMEIASYSKGYDDVLEILDRLIENEETNT